MSEYNNQNKGSKHKSSFAKPGDENIVSGKSFFLSFGKQKKGPSNPLLESEKNKNNAKNNSAGGQNKNPQGSQQDARQDKSKDRNNFKGKHHGHYHGDRKQNQNREKQQNQNVKPEEKTAVAVHEERREKDNHGYNHKNRHQKNNRHNHKGGDMREEKRQDKSFNIQKKGHKDNNPNKTPVEQSIQEQSAKQERTSVMSRFEDRKRQKHKKEKFVPTAPQVETASEELLQPIVDRASIMSSSPRGLGLRSAKSSFTAGVAGAVATNGDEPMYVDRNRPLAEQILEQSKPKTYKTHLTENADTVEVIGVRFREAGKVYYFDPRDCKVEKGQAVIVETARGVEYGFCAIANRFVSVDNIVPPLKPILRVATSDDTERYESNKLLEEGAAKIFREKVRDLGLEMSLVYVEYTFDNGKLIFYFTADGRVDFRELIKELAAAFRTRIELRQIGVRDEAKIVGGLGICGRPVCCKSFLGEFSQVSIKMAKDQNLFINSSKISGTCGRFMCCIRYEDEVYQKEYERTPKVDAIVETPEGRGVVVESNALKGQVKVLLDDKPEAVAVPFKCTEVKLLGYIKRDNENEIPDGVDIPEDSEN